jgi:hypothetical protein
MKIFYIEYLRTGKACRQESKALITVPNQERITNLSFPNAGRTTALLKPHISAFSATPLALSKVPCKNKTSITGSCPQVPYQEVLRHLPPFQPP